MASPISSIQRVTIIRDTSLAPIRQQLALARALLDNLEALILLSHVERVPRTRVIEELVRLGCRILDAAASLVHEETLAHADKQRDPVRSHTEDEEAESAAPGTAVAATR
jgi:hypothetical protein